MVVKKENNLSKKIPLGIKLIVAFNILFLIYKVVSFYTLDQYVNNPFGFFTKIIFPFLFLIPAIFLLKGKEWARMMQIILTGFLFLGSVKGIMLIFALFAWGVSDAGGISEANLNAGSMGKFIGGSLNLFPSFYIPISIFLTVISLVIILYLFFNEKAKEFFLS
ncbi:hypothetical protein J4416_01560 [Candidatus Pacearchaeota archaeon]|nr:hypothetical protein [uncultured archaeon]AQS34487.1 hypothetical protein [uncultured archaeon]MBS3081609.1 hypothetical protein [Candidatus Pacearchaeota archaeon]